MTAPDLQGPAYRLLELLDRRLISARDLLEAQLERVKRLNPLLNAVVALDVEGARHAADLSDQRRAAGDWRALEGLPVTIKDAFDVAGVVSTGGAKAYAGRVPAEDSNVAARLRAAGAVIFGKTNVPVFSGDFQTTNPIYGTTANPWDVSLSPGGSSGGAAAAVAAGLTAFEVGSDLGGSLRWPAHACGVFALKTTWGLVSTWGHVPPPVERRLARDADLVVAGPIARCAADLDLILPVLAGPRDQPLAPPRRNEIKGLRVALWADDPFAPTTRAVRTVVLKAARMLGDAGAIVDERARPAFSFEEAYEVYALLNHAIVAYGLPPKVRERLQAMAGDFAPGDLSHQALQARGSRMNAEFYQQLRARRDAIKRHWARFFQDHDVVLCPPAPVTAIPTSGVADVHARTLDIDGKSLPYLDFLIWSSLATGADLPAACAPVMLTSEGLPTGVQIIAAHGEDRTAIAVAGMIEQLSAGIGGGMPVPLP